METTTVGRTFSMIHTSPRAILTSPSLSQRVASLITMNRSPGTSWA
ncbi:MAG: hypothetical protein KatS3mg103_0387 [Phycisphaerales bacterium]|nr:MAG: hypothetical protein KatS3mg103_0387 [Phycisphaerales bacterium]